MAWCAGSKAETTGVVFRVRDDEPTPWVGAGLHRTPEVIGGAEKRKPDAAFDAFSLEDRREGCLQARTEFGRTQLTER